MEQTNFLQNIYSILVLIFTTPFYFEMFIFFAISFFMMIFFMIKKDKKIRKIIFIIYLILILLLFGYYGNFLVYLFDGIVDLIFNIVYFPNALTYFIMLLLININAIFSIFNMYAKISFLNSRCCLLINIMNIFCFSFTYLLFFMILETVTKNNLDFFSQTSLYSNTQFQILIQASTVLFVINILFNIIILVYSKLTFSNKTLNKTNE